jgi:acyl-CoA synthetase (AMP-forming)/AMP-acid ligase II
MSTSYLTQSLHRALRHCPDAIATVCGPRRHSYAQFVDRVARMASALRELRMGPGDRVGILMQNSDRYLELYFAVWWGGGSVNPVNTRWSAAEIAYSIDDCTTRILIVDDAFAPLAKEIAGRCKSLHTLIHAGEGAAPTGMYEYERLLAESNPIPDALRANDDLAGVYYTGGTTGFPKGVMLSHANLHSSIMSGLAEGLVQEGDVGLHVAPMFHLADGFFALMLFARGSTHVVLPTFQPEAAMVAIQREQVSAVLLVPTMIQMLVDHPALPSHRLDSLRRVIYGAAPISEAVLSRAMARLPNASFSQCYGQTEMSPLVSVLSAELHAPQARGRGKLRSAGRPASGVEVRIVDGEGREVPRGTVGEIAARGAGVMTGYWNRPEETAAALRDGWMHSGDGAYMDEGGFLFVVDRVKDMIVSGGENVYSAEVENALAQHPAIAACAVIGIPDDSWGEAVHAVLVCKPGVAPPDLEQVKAHCRALIANYKCPRSIEYRETLPLSGAGKVLKTELREPWWKGRQRRVA